MTDQKPFVELDVTERLTFMRCEPHGYEKAMEAEALAHQAEFQRTGKMTRFGSAHLFEPPPSRRPQVTDGRPPVAPADLHR